MNRKYDCKSKTNYLHINSNLNNTFYTKIAYPLSLILIPTKELAEQVYKVSKKLLLSNRNHYC